MVKVSRYVTQYTLLVILSEVLLPLGQVEKADEPSTNLEGELPALVQVVLSPPNLLTESELVVLHLFRLLHSFLVNSTLFVLLVFATQGGYDRLFSTTNRHRKSQEAMH